MLHILFLYKLRRRRKKKPTPKQLTEMIVAEVYFLRLARFLATSFTSSRKILYIILFSWVEIVWKRMHIYLTQCNISFLLLLSFLFTRTNYKKKYRKKKLGSHHFISQFISSIDFRFTRVVWFHFVELFRYGVKEMP